MRWRGARVTLRGLMVVVLYVAIDAAAFHHAATAPDGRPGAAAFLAMTVLVPIAAGAAWAARGMHGPGKSLY